MLLAGMERWLRASGVQLIIAMAGLDTTTFWNRQGYSADSVNLLPAQWALLRDPFGGSTLLGKML